MEYTTYKLIQTCLHIYIYAHTREVVQVRLKRNNYYVKRYENKKKDMRTNTS